VHLPPTTRNVEEEILFGTLGTAKHPYYKSFYSL